MLYSQESRDFSHERFKTNIQSILDRDLSFVYTDAHAIRRLSNFYTNLTLLDKVDWEVMASDYWNDTDEDLNRKARRQAEFLVHHSVPLSACLGFAVLNHKTRVKVEQFIHEAGLSLPVAIRPQFYY